MHKRTLITLCLGWLASLIIVGGIAGYYYTKLQEITQVLKKYKGYVMHVHICINYEAWNGTVEWYNDTLVPLGCNLYEATKTVAVVNATLWNSPEGYFVDAINDVWNNVSENCFWMWYRWLGKGWEYGYCAADAYTLSDGEIVMWKYEKPNYS